MPAIAPEMSDKLARSAFELFAQHGIRDVSMDMIAAHANCTKGSLYWHYDTKKDVILAACRHYYHTWHERIREETDGWTDPLKRLERAVRFSVRSCMVDPKNRIFTLGIMAMSLQDDDIRASWASFYDQAREFFIELTRAARDAGQIHPADPRRAVDLMLVATEGIKLRSAIDAGAAIAAEEKRIGEEFMAILGGLGDTSPGR